MQHCTHEMFERFGIEPDDHVTHTRLCPKISDFETFKVAGSLHNKVKRTSFSLSIRQCETEPNLNRKCKSKEEID